MDDRQDMNDMPDAGPPRPAAQGRQAASAASEPGAPADPVPDPPDGTESGGRESSGRGSGGGPGEPETEEWLDRRARRQAGGALMLLGAAILAVAAFSTPWQVLPPGAPDVPPDPVRDFTAAQIARADAFDAATAIPGYLSLALAVVFAGLLVVTPFGARVLGWLRGPWWLRVIEGVLVLTAIKEALRWPLGMWFETRLRAFGLSTQDWAGWTADRLKNLAVNVVLLSIMLVVLIALARRFRRWWLPAAVGAFLFTVAASFVYPVVFEPLFNDFHAMPAGPLRTNLLAMAERDHVPVEDVLVADASRRTTALNAYVSGFGATRRIVVYDTLLKAPQPQVELVVAHELGHAKRGDVLTGTLIGGLAAAFGAVLLYVVFGAVRRRTGVVSVADPRAVGVLIGLMGLGTLLSGPAQNVVSRHIEARADVHALDLTRDPVTFAAMQKRLAVTNISDVSPNLFDYVMYASHPTAPERIAIARSWARLNGVGEP
ncbi:M48 family metallopeptidase [Nonomuraea sp. NPDC005983]|uniref:M48 family metallopeptidase n=1 Tax=Nonomuraea sp. NPDC005983 TaxID=3155595 RepID=UPI0033A81EC8